MNGNGSAVQDRQGRSRLNRTAAFLAVTVGVWLGAGTAFVLPASAAATPAFRPDSVVLGFQPGVSAERQRAIESSVKAVRARRLGPVVRGRRHASALAVKVRGGRARVLASVRSLRRRREVRFAEPDYLMHENAAPNDPSFGLQWGSNNTGQLVNGISGTPGADDKALAAWGVSTGSRSVVIGETDSGVDYKHPDLAANVWSNPGGIGGCASGTRGYNVLAGTCDPMDDETYYHGHGTHVAGILGAAGNNSAGVAGVNWSTTILPVKWLNSAGDGSTSQLISALNWLVAAKQAGVNLRVVNDSATYVGTAYSQALADEIDVLGANDILFVTAAGNTGDNNDNLAYRRYPCGYDRPTEICVTASNQSDQLPSWANYGATTVDLAAPGDNVYSTLRGGTYGYVSGGSMASPQVAGTAALILSTGYLSASALKDDILRSVDPLPSLSGRVRTGGRLNVCKALPGCTVPPPPPPPFGKTSVGASTDSFAADRKRVSRYSLGVSVNVDKLKIYLAPTSTSGQQVLKGVVYADAAGAPGALLGASNELVFRSTGAAGWYDLTFSSPLGLAPGNYWIGVITGGSPYVASFRWDSVAASRAYNVNAYSAGASSPFGALTGTDGEQMSIYASYAAAAAPTSAPASTAPPSVSGTTRAGEVLTATTGSWSGTPTVYAYQWSRCNSTGGSCASVAGATGQAYTLTAADVGSTERVSVTASNSAGASSPSTSSATAVVQAAPATFGKTTVGGSSDSFGADRKRVNAYSLPAAGSVSKLSVYLAATGTSGQQALKGVVYADSGGAPGALLATSNELVFHSSDAARWYDLALPAPLRLAAGRYWIGVLTGGTAGVAGFRWSSVTGSRLFNANAYSTGPSDPYGPVSTDSEQMSLFATYTPG